MRITIHHTSFVAVFGACIVDIVALQHIVTNIGLASDLAAIAKTKTQEGEECSFVDPTLQTRDENIRAHTTLSTVRRETRALRMTPLLLVDAACSIWILVHQSKELPII
jgi:hypothetical protein